LGADGFGEVQQRFVLARRIAAAQIPVLKSACRLDGAIDVNLAAIGDMDEDLAVNRRSFGEGRAVERRGIGSAD
jgi:hypothetical protein